MASAEHNAKSAPKTIQRIEVLTGPERRRQWSTEEKERIVAESFGGSDSVSRIARRHGLLPQQLFTWRRALRQSTMTVGFAPVAVVSSEVAKVESKQAALPAKARRARSVGSKKMAPAVMVEIEACGITVRVLRGADRAALAAIVRALKAAS